MKTDTHLAKDYITNNLSWKPKVIFVLLQLLEFLVQWYMGFSSHLEPAYLIL